MSRYSPQVLIQRGVTLPEVAMAGVEAFKAQRDRGRKQGFEDKAEDRAAGRYGMDQDQNRRAQNTDTREQGRYETQQEEAKYNKDNVRPYEQASRVVGFQNAGGMAPGAQGGVEVAPGLRIDPNNIALARQKQAEVAKAAVDERELRNRERQTSNQLTIAREGDNTQRDVARINASRPVGGSQYNFGGGGGSAQPGAAQRFVANERNAKMIGTQITALDRRMGTDLKYSEDEVNPANVARLQTLQSAQDRILAQNDSISGGIPLPSLGGGPAVGPPKPRTITPQERAKGASDLAYANDVTAKRERTVSKLTAERDRLKGAGALTMQARMDIEAAIKEARTRSPAQATGRPQ